MIVYSCFCLFLNLLACSRFPFPTSREVTNVFEKCSGRNLGI